MKVKYNNNKTKILNNQTGDSINYTIKNKNSLKRNYSSNFSHTITRNNYYKNIKNKYNILKENASQLEKNKIKNNSKPNILNNLKYNRIKNKLYFDLKLENKNNIKINNIRQNLPTQELTDSIFDKKFELSKVFAKIKGNKEKKEKLLLENKNIIKYKELSEKIKINRNQNLLKNRYNNDDFISTYINKNEKPFYGFNNNKLNFNDYSNSKNKLEKIKVYLSCKKSRNKIFFDYEESTLEKLSKLKTELKAIKFIKKIKDKKYIINTKI